MGAFTLTDTATVKAKGFMTGYTDSLTTSADFTIEQPVVETIVDNQDANTEWTGTWSVSSSPNPWAGDSLYNNGGQSFRWIPDLPQAGTSDVYVWWTYHANRSTNVPFRVGHAGGVATARAP